MPKRQHSRQHRRVALVAAFLLLVGPFMVSSSPAQAAPPRDEANVAVSGDLGGITAEPTLGPEFSTSINDYVVRCQTGVNNIVLHLAAGNGTITAGGQTGATVTVTVPRNEDQAVVVTAGSGDASKQYWIRCLPHDFPQMQFNRPGTPPPGWYLTGTLLAAKDGSSGLYAMILDEYGTPVWYKKTPGGAIDTRLLPGQKIAWAPTLGPSIGADPTKGFEVYDLATQTSQTVKTPEGPTDPHELLQVANGNRFMIATPLRSGLDLSSLGKADPGNGTIVDCIIEEVNQAGGLVWSWRASDHIAIKESGNPFLVTVNKQLAADIYHCNSVDIDPAPDPSVADVMISVRHTNAVYLLDKQTKAIRWKLSGNQVTGPDNEKQLTIAGDSLQGFSGQHDARFQGDGRISLFDDQSFTSGYARGVEYQVNELLGTALHLREFASPDGKNSPAGGSYRTYANGTDNLIGWGLKAGSGFNEVDAGNNLLFSMSYPKGDAEYRVVKEPKTALDINLLRRTAGLPRPGLPPKASKVGVHRSNFWLLRNSATEGVGDVSLSYGDPSDFPVAGDWNGDGTDTPGIVRPSGPDSVWALRNANTSGVGDTVFAFGGSSGEFPVAGDWDGNGTDSAGLFNVYTARWSLRNATTTGGPDSSFLYGDPGDWPIPWR